VDNALGTPRVAIGAQHSPSEARLFQVPSEGFVDMPGHRRGCVLSTTMKMEGPSVCSDHVL
jgi:hypothetical protein